MSDIKRTKQPTNVGNNWQGTTETEGYKYMQTLGTKQDN